MQEDGRPDRLAPLIGAGKADPGGDIGQGSDEKTPGEAGEAKLPLVLDGEEERGDDISDEGVLLSYRAEYDPAEDDLLNEGGKQDGDRDHVGIVTAVVDDKVFTVEGNSSDLCRQKRYFLDDPVIYGYGVIKE